MLQSTIEAKQDRYGDLSQEVGQTWKIIGTSYLSMGKSEKALSALKKVNQLYRQLLAYLRETYRGDAGNFWLGVVQGLEVRETEVP